MKKLLAMLLMLTMSSTAWAQLRPSIVDIPPGEDQIVVVEEGQRASFSGQLYSNQTALRWANWLQQYRFRYQIDLEEQKRINQVEIELLNRKLDLEREQYKKEVDLYAKQLEEARKEKSPPWYQSFWTGTGAGVVGTLLVTTLSVWAISTARK